MTINQFINQNHLRPADAVIMKKKFFGMLDHYVIYLGIYRNNQTFINQHIFVANYTKGVRVISEEELSQFLQYLIPTDIDRFKGGEYERPNAVQRAWSRINEKAYNYLENNCEHFKNWVHNGEHRSEQAEKFVQGSLAVAGITALGLLVSAITSES